FLEQILADERGVITGAASGEDEPVAAAQLSRADVEAAEMSRGVLVREPAAHGVFEGFGLLVNLFEHVVAEGALVGISGSRLDLMNGGVDARLIGVKYLPTLVSQRRELMIVEIDDLLRIGDEGRRVAGQKLLPLADADDERTAQACPNEHV